MKAVKLATCFGFVLALTACPDQPRDPAVDPMVDPVTTPTMQPAPTTMDAPPPGGMVATLEGVGAATGEVHAIPRTGSTEIWVTLRGGNPNESHGVRVHSGTCQSPGPELARITAIGTDGMGQGQSRTDVGHAPNLIMDGNHIVAVYAPGTEPTRDRPLACATLPEMGAAGV